MRPDWRRVAEAFARHARCRHVEHEVVVTHCECEHDMGSFDDLHADFDAVADALQWFMLQSDPPLQPQATDSSSETVGTT